MKPNFKKGDVIKCVFVRSELVLGRTYVVEGVKHRPGDDEPLVQVNGLWYMSNRFDSVAPPAQKSESVVDFREEKLRAMLTTSSDPYTCKKCGAPKATCNYH